MPKNSVEDINNRHNAILERLPERSNSAAGYKAAELTKWLQANSYQVTPKTVNRDLAELYNQNKVECDHDKTKIKSWFRKRGVNSNKVMTGAEAFLHTLVSRRMSHLLPSSLYQDLDPVIKEAEKVLTRPDLASQQQWFKKIVTLPGLLAQPDLEHHIMRTVMETLLYEYWLIITYKNRKQETKENVLVMPLGIAELNGIYYLVTQFNGHSDIRHLRIDRLLSVEKSEVPFTYPRDFDLQRYVDTGVFNYADTHEIQLKLKMNKYSSKHLIEQPLSQDMNITDLDKNHCLVEATVLGGQRLQWWLKGMGCNVEVLEPAELRQEMIQHIKSLDLLYQNQKS